MKAREPRVTSRRDDFLSRFLQLQMGLIAFGFSLALMVEANLGLGPWDVLHQGLSKALHTRIGWVVIGVGLVVLLLWIPLRQRPGIGTVCNVFVVGIAVNLSLTLLPTPKDLVPRISFLILGIVTNGLATGLYIGAGLGPGPRDGIMTGFARRGHSIRVVRTLTELAVLAIGWILGGSIGVGTVAYALAIGPLAHFALPKLTRTPMERPAT